MAIALSVILRDAAGEMKFEGSHKGENEDLHLGHGHLLTRTQRSVGEKRFGHTNPILVEFSINKAIVTKLLEEVKQLRLLPANKRSKIFAEDLRRAFRKFQGPNGSQGGTSPPSLRRPSELWDHLGAEKWCLV